MARALLEIDPVNQSAWRTVIDREDAPRAIEIHDFSTDSSKSGVFMRDCFQYLGIAQWEIEIFANLEVGWGDVFIRVEFASITAAKEVKAVFVDLGYSVVYDGDPWMGDVE
ncbi:hypothetical protein RUND412_004012 [Rhizina undulata]